MPTFQFMVNAESYTTQEHILTPIQILQIAGDDPANYYLVEIKGNHQESYQGKPNDEIHMHQNAKFITVFMGPTPVS